MFCYFLDFMFYYFLIILPVLVSVAFLTLLERKILSYCQVRKGPNKVGYVGILQPFSDAVKLFSKEESPLISANFFIFSIAPFFSIFIAMFFWLLYPGTFHFCDFSFSLLFVMVCLGLAVYGLIFSGWASNSKYALLGSLRAVAQSISYEIPLIFLIVMLCFLYECYSFALYDNFWSFFMFCLPVAVVFLFASIAETNRAPLDLAEGESELVSGFNVEYGGFKFALLFLAEYANILWFSFMISLVFFNGFICMFIVLLLMFLVFRASYPRMRYDSLMSFMWKNLLFFTIFFYLSMVMLLV